MEPKLFELLWMRADAERELGERERAAELYRRAFACLGVNLDQISEYLQEPRVENN